MRLYGPGGRGGRYTGADPEESACTDLSGYAGATLRGCACTDPRGQCNCIPELFNPKCFAAASAGQRFGALTGRTASTHQVSRPNSARGHRFPEVEGRASMAGCLSTPSNLQWEWGSPFKPRVWFPCKTLVATFRAGPPMLEAAAGGGGGGGGGGERGGTTFQVTSWALAP